MSSLNRVTAATMRDMDGKRNGTGSSHWSRSSCWSGGRWCPATAAPARSSRTPPIAASCCHPPPSATTPRRTAPAARRGAARRGRGARAGGGRTSSRAGAAASPSPRGRRRFPTELKLRGACPDLTMFTTTNPSTAARSRLAMVGMDGVAWRTCHRYEQWGYGLD